VGPFKLRVIAPCPEVSNPEAGDNREWFCPRCSLTVHNLSAMSGEAARNLIAGSDGRLCVRYRQSPDGTVITRRRFGWIRAAVRGLGVGVLVAAFWAGVVLVQRPWQALARKLAAVPPRAPTLRAEARRPALDYEALFSPTMVFGRTGDYYEDVLRPKMSSPLDGGYTGGAVADVGQIRWQLFEPPIEKPRRK
jgi:hypothetical protein